MERANRMKVNKLKDYVTATFPASGAKLTGLAGQSTLQLLQGLLVHGARVLQIVKGLSGHLLVIEGLLRLKQLGLTRLRLADLQLANISRLRKQAVRPRLPK